MSTHQEISLNTSVGTGLSTGSAEETVLGWGIETYTSWEACEDDAINALNAGNQGLFTQILLQSPSIYSLKLGVQHAAELKWCDSLRTLLSAIQPLKVPTKGSDYYTDHPLYRKYYNKYPYRGFSSNSRGDKDLEENALLAATVDGSIQVVQILVEFIDVNFGTSSYEPFFAYVYKNKDKASRDECLKYILPKLNHYYKHLIAAAGNGDLPSVKYLINRLEPQENYQCSWAIEKAIENGHDEVAKWIISQPGLIEWKKYTGGIVKSAVDAQNYDMLVFISGYVPKLSAYEFGYHTADALWKFLKDKDRELYKKFVPQYPDGYTLYMA